MTGEEIWGFRAHGILLDQRRVLQGVLRTADFRLSQLDELRNALYKDRDVLIVKYEEIEKELDALEEFEGDPAVLVRRTIGGYGPTPYHDALAPCGHVWRREQFDELLLGEAEAAGYAPCGFCGAQAKGRRPLTDAA